MAGEIKDAGNNNGLGKTPTAMRREDARVHGGTGPSEPRTGLAPHGSEPKSQAASSGLTADLKKATKSVADYVTSSVRQSDPENTIVDAKFNKDLETLRSLHSFLIREAKSLPENFSLGMLNTLKTGGPGDKGRSPTAEEWQAIEKKTQVLFAQLTDADRKRFLASQMPNFLPKIAVWLVAISIGSMIMSVVMAELPLFGVGVNGAFMVFFFLLWLMSLGAIGSAAFIGFNAISVSSDITFDISDSRFIVQRIVLGALFALFFTLPFGFHEFLSFAKSLSTAALNRATVPTQSELAFTNQSLLLIMPFVLGYSTSLVILILNRMISSASTLFGAGEAAVKPKAAAPRDTS
ncbi:hypothetical protein [Roseibium sp. MMSF_3544]|uniref:hypothetical protein n=1 Tax=unclassified Roseibium TaxID=2629323 RepID=UPI00273FBD78|nr:hypothetical protein [Roseibium sp. MMSF_3544]